MDVSLALAFAAGLLSFVSPCVLALVPVYLAFLGDSASRTDATAPSGSGARPWHGSVLGQAALFVLGFSALFVLLGVSFGLLGRFLLRGEEAEVVRQVAGVIVMSVGLLTTGLFGPVLERFSLAVPTDTLPAARSARALALGALVAVGWSPCIGPVLGAILTLGLSSADVLAAAALLVAYSVGLALPFLAAAVALPRMRPVIGWLRRHHGWVRAISGVFIVVVGVLIFTNAFARLATMFDLFI
jgi:cytochrome c-type biogenesis protein